MIDGWQEVLQLMVVGDFVRVWIPSHLAYGDDGDNDDGVPSGPLVFDIKLNAIQRYCWSTSVCRAN